MTARFKPGASSAVVEEAALVLGRLGLSSIDDLIPWIGAHAESLMNDAARDADNAHISVPLVFSLALRAGDPEYVYLLMAHGPEITAWQSEDIGILDKRVWLKAKPCTRLAVETIIWAPRTAGGWRHGPELMGWLAYQPWNHRYAIRVVGVYTGEAT